MSIKEELHNLVDCMTDERAEAALPDLRHLAEEAGSEDAATTLARRMGPLAISGRDFQR